MMYIQVLCVLITLCVALVQSARILGIMCMPSFSHQIVLRPLWKELSLKGHQVTVLTTDPMNDPLLSNLTEIDLKESYRLWNNFNLFDMIDIPIWKMWENFTEFNDDLIDNQLKNPKVQNLINNPNEQFDLLIIEGFHSAHFAFAYKFKCPFISVLTLDASSFIHHEIGHPSHYALYPDFMLPFQEPLNFFQQLESLHYNLYIRYMSYYYLFPSQQRLVEKHFGKNYPPIEEIYRNYSIFFLNSNSILHPIRPLLPNVVQIWGKNHITKSKPLPKDLETVLNKSTNGVIYFSLGSNVKSKYISTDIKDAIISVFKELPYTILWKFEDEQLPNKPDNVIISKWFPQQDILRHPNIKLFITQGGLQSFEEALEAKVPLIGIPIMGDQKSNVRRLASKGLGIMLEYKSITKETFKSAILEAINNPRYRENVKMYAELVGDQPSTGPQLAMWWTEYVLRHKGAPHLRNPAYDLPWYQHYYLDIIALCIVVVMISLYLAFALIGMVIRVTKCLFKHPKEKQM